MGKTFVKKEENYRFFSELKCGTIFHVKNDNDNERKFDTLLIKINEIYSNNNKFFNAVYLEDGELDYINGIEKVIPYQNIDIIAS